MIIQILKVCHNTREKLVVTLIIALSPEALRRIACHDYTAPRITAMQFIEETLLRGLSHTERLKIVTSTKFRGQYLTLLSETLKISKRTIYLWGTDIELPSMPKYHQHKEGICTRSISQKEAANYCKTKCCLIFELVK